VRVSSFEAPTGTQIREAVERLGGAGLKALLLDLRNNPGGLVPSALETAALFLDPGKLLVSVRGRAVEADEVRVPAEARPYRFPLAVLLNEKSASASEIVAGALQDHDRAVIVGSPSFGKGLVQSVFPLSQGTGLALTTAYYYTPSGRSIQRPLREGRLGTAPPAVSAEPEYRTASGRKVRGGGGIQPDRLVEPEAVNRLRMVLVASAALTSFATETIRKAGRVGQDFEVTDDLLDEFQIYLAARSIQPGVAQWSTEREWIRSRLRQEIFNQALGVARGDEIEIRRDPQVRGAIDALIR
jgi:carboxyl-terminal processing protease